MNQRTEANIQISLCIIVRYPILARGKICHDLAWVWSLEMAITFQFLIISHDTLRKLTIHMLVNPVFTAATVLDNLMLGYFDVGDHQD